MSTESHIQVPPDSTGKKVRTLQKAVGIHTVEMEVKVSEPVEASTFFFKELYHSPFDVGRYAIVTKEGLADANARWIADVDYRLLYIKMWIGIVTRGIAEGNIQCSFENTWANAVGGVAKPRTIADFSIHKHNIAPYDDMGYYDFTNTRLIINTEETLYCHGQVRNLSGKNYVGFGHLVSKLFLMPV